MSFGASLFEGFKHNRLVKSILLNHKCMGVNKNHKPLIGRIISKDSKLFLKHDPYLGGGGFKDCLFSSRSLGR